MQTGHKHHLVPAGHGWRRCQHCGEEVRAPKTKTPAGKPHLVNGYPLTDIEYELVAGYRRRRDFKIERAKEEYEAALKALVTSRRVDGDG